MRPVIRPPVDVGGRDQHKLGDKGHKGDAALEHQQVAIGQEGAVGGVDALKERR